MAGASQYRASDFIDAIPGSGGIISVIAKRVGCAWHTAKKYIDSYATVRAAYDDECQGILDLAESTVIRSIKEGGAADARWYLTMKGRGRGYAPTQRQELDVTVKDLDSAIERELERLAARGEGATIDPPEGD
uniref:Terminase n=1 Tax=viral metagenome TaxID=1070528 RepID=A0A6M3KWU9_9ZZZZ